MHDLMSFNITFVKFFLSKRMFYLFKKTDISKSGKPFLLEFQTWNMKNAFKWKKCIKNKNINVVNNIKNNVREAKAYEESAWKIKTIMKNTIWMTKQ